MGVDQILLVRAHDVGRKQDARRPTGWAITGAVNHEVAHRPAAR